MKSKTVNWERKKIIKRTAKSREKVPNTQDVLTGWVSKELSNAA